MRKRSIGIASLAAILVSYLVFRYPLFYLHGMKEFPLILCDVGALLITLTGLIKQNKVLPVTIVLGYIVGFAAGAVFQYDYGEGLNNMWIIWMWCFIAVSLIGIIVERVMVKRARKNKWKREDGIFEE